MGGPDSEPSPAPHCGYPEGRGAFLGLETEWEEAPPVSELVPWSLGQGPLGTSLPMSRGWTSLGAGPNPPLLQ